MADDDVYLVMQVVSGQSDTTKWFDYSPGYFLPTVRIEWGADTMFVVLPNDVAHYLLSHNYARAMTEDEIEDYTKPIELPPLPKQRKKESSDDPGNV